MQQPRAPGLCQASPSWLQAPYSLMTLGWLTCFRRLNSDSRSRSSFGEAFSEMHINEKVANPSLLEAPSVTMQSHYPIPGFCKDPPFPSQTPSPRIPQLGAMLRPRLVNSGLRSSRE